MAEIEIHQELAHRHLKYQREHYKGPAKKRERKTPTSCLKPSSANHRRHTMAAKKKLFIIRTTSAGVFFGDVISLENGVAIVKNARRLWRWSGASSLSELAAKGVSRPDKCKFPCSVPGETTLIGVIEVIPCTSAGVKSIMEVPEWTQH